MKTSIKTTFFCLLFSFHTNAWVKNFSVLLPKIISPTVITYSTDFGTVGFSGNPSTWFTISTNSYPETTPLSLYANLASSKGRVYTAPWGVTIGEPGDYWVSITAILQNPTENSTVLIPVFLAQNEEFNQENPSLIGGVVTLESGIISNLHGHGILKNVAEGTRLSLVATNSGYEDPVPVVVVSWQIALYKLP